MFYLEEISRTTSTFQMLSYNRANRAVALLCNHQRAVPKTHDKSMANLQAKIDQKTEEVDKAEKEYKAAKKEKSKGSQFYYLGGCSFYPDCADLRLLSRRQH